MPPTVLVCGLGGMGSAAAAHLARRGVRVVGFDAHRPPHRQGASHGSTRIIRQAYFEHPSYVPLLQRAYELWRELEGLRGVELLRETGGLMLGPPGAEVVEGSLRSARLHSLPHELLDAREIRRRFPPFAVGDDTVALYERAAGFLWCEASVQAHLDAAAAEGAELRFDEPVLSWSATPEGGVEVRTARGVVRGDQLVLAPGPWAPSVLAELGLPIVVTRQVLCWFDAVGGVQPFAADRFPVWIHERLGTTPTYGFPAVDGPRGGVKTAFHGGPEGERCTPETADRSIRPAEVERLREALRGLLPALAAPLVQGATCLYSSTPDAHFVISPHPRHPQVQIACGFSGHGFKFCSVVGEILADLATVGRTAHDLSLFAPGRFAA
ncbi:MAG: N-methyl-L-tryptophan oxidase [Verrucomicrobia bacterium]|nr:N-methyl-L-tryptophan oxidase [Verrucomicrobiota bacterium]